MNNTPPLDTIYFYLAKGCNMKCRHCWIEPKYQKDSSTNPQPTLPLSLYRSIIDQALPLGLQRVKFTGGEPLLHPHFLDFIDLTLEKELRLIVETNGCLVTDEIATALAAGRRTFVSVSLDGADAETHEWVRGVEGGFEESCRGVRRLAATGLHTQIIFTIMHHNQNQVKEIIDLAVELGASSVKYNLLQPVSRGETMHERDQAVPVKDLIKLGRWVEKELAQGSPIPLSYSHPPAFRPLSSMLGRTSGIATLCGIKGIIGVLSDGTYALCGIGDVIPEMAFGNAERGSLADIWENNGVLNDIRFGLPEKLEGVCGKCVMAANCLGNCVAQNYYRTGSIWASFWFCQEAHELGEFPESRLVPEANEMNVS